MKNRMLLKNRNVACGLYKIIKPLFLYFFVVAFLLAGTEAYAMRKTTESKISLSSRTNMALSVYMMVSVGNCGRVTAGTTEDLDSGSINTGISTSTLKLVNAAENNTIRHALLLVQV